MDSGILKERFDLAKSVSEKAASFLLSHENLRKEISAKAENDYVTSADKECERLIISSIREAFPEDSIYGEESGETDGDGCGRWIIDPIDGTVDFMASFPNYTISIAFEDENGIAFGIVTVPRQHETFSAFRGEGSFLNGTRIHTDETTPLEKTLAILVPPHRQHDLLHGYIEKMERFYYSFTDMRSLGSAAVSLCYVASGRCTAYFELCLHLYDIAAGLIILKEAGGIYSLKENDKGSLDVAASSVSAYEKMMECIDD